MSTSAVLYLVGMALVFIGERLVEDLPAYRVLAVLLGVGSIGAAAALRGSHLRGADDAGISKGHRTALALTAVGGGSLLLYALSTVGTAELLGFEGAALERWSTSWGALWPVVWMCGTIPLIVVDRALKNAPVVAPPGRIRQALNHGLAAALGIALVFPVNFLADRHVKDWDLAYFKTADAGSATKAIVESLDKPVHVYAFYPPHSRVGDEVERYFAELQGPKLTFQRVDQTASPGLARKLEIRQNGRIAISNERFEPGAPESKNEESQKENDSSPVIESISLSSDFEDAEKDLERFDETVHEHLISVSQGERVAYLTVGHGEFQTAREAQPPQRIRQFRNLLEQMGFRVEKTGLGQGLADGVPDEADLVAVIGPTDRFLPAEVDALKQFLDSGGSMVLALEPEYARNRNRALDQGEPLVELLAKIGVGMEEGVLASERSYYPLSQNQTDRLNLITDEFSSHPTTATLSDASAFLFVPTAGYLEVPDDAETDLTTVVRSPSSAWVDTNDNLEFDEDAGESRESRPIMVAAMRKEADETPPWRVLLSADASAFSDLALGNRANRRFLYDSANWLLGTPSLSGRVQNEEDVKIRHTKEGQSVWFYGTVVGVPLLILIAGAFRVWRRGKGGDE